LNIDETTQMLAQLTEKISDSTVALYFIEADKNLDQQLNFIEFQNLLTAIAGPIFRTHIFVENNDEEEEASPVDTDEVQNDQLTAQPEQDEVQEQKPHEPLTFAEARKMLNSEVKNYSLLDLADVDKDYRANISEAFAYVSDYQTIGNFSGLLRNFMENAKDDGLLDGAGFIEFLTAVVGQCAKLKAAHSIDDDCAALRSATVDREFFWNEGRPPVSPAQEITLATIMFYGVAAPPQQSESASITTKKKKRHQISPAETVLLYPADTYARLVSRIME